MTPADPWRSAADPRTVCRLLQAASNAARTKAGRRKLRLAGVGCCRRLPAAFVKDRLRAALDVADRLADGTATRSDARSAGRAVWWAGWVWSRADRAAAMAARSVLSNRIWAAALAGEWLLDPALDAARGVPADAERKSQADVFRCVFADPRLPPAAFPKKWRTSAVTGLATAVDADRAFARLPVLADALEEAGCDHLDLLRHAREDATHVRGCRVVDAALGRG